MTVIVFNDQTNKEFDSEYSEKLKDSFRKIYGWIVEKDTRIDRELDKFSFGYSKDKRNTDEVAVIFALANGISNDE